MNRRIAVIVVCALVLSVCVSFLVYRAVGTKSTAPRAVKTIPVIVAARDLEVGSLIRDVDLKTIAWVGSAPKGAIGKPDAIRNRGVASPIYEGEPITEIRLAHQGSGGGLAVTIPNGMRACAVRVNEVVGVAGFAVPGMRVDVLVTGTPPGANPEDGPHVRTLLQNIQVLTAGTNFQRDGEGKPEQAQVVTLLVTPAQAEILSLAGNETHIQLVLRNPADTDVVKAPGTMVSSLFGGADPAPDPVEPLRKETAPPRVSQPVPVSPAPPVEQPIAAPAAPPTPKPFVVEELNGATRTQATFRSEEGQK
jgi:pilus assembly protein CpaB